MGRLNDKVAIVTGGARGLGGAAVDALCAEGASVVIADVIDAAGQERAARLTAEGHKAHYVHLDVRDSAQWAAIVEDTLARWGRLDCLVNNAGINIPIDIEEATLEQFQSILDVNLLGAFLGIKVVLPAMRKNDGGSIINVSSNSTAMVLPTTSLYGASKAALANLTKTTAVHCGLRGDHIRCNSIHPGMHLTEMIDNPEVQALPQVRALKSAIPMGRMGLPAEFGKVVTFLASEDSSYMTAAELFTDGGLTVVSFADPSRG
ncbi:glucose 1-dehydrogenase [Sphingobium lactosutens]|uniref:glucose 1-dehydrogenase n=1 Tax=Sphingobium lactosutens TaxID=522773 RepID=UPI0015BF4759|nr:glucose 1-dehydrogenase [Sphingobium lactosutens]